MPNIKQYDAPALDIRPTEVGVEATAAVGRRAGAFFNQMGQSIGGGVKDLGDAYVEYEDHRQISAGAKAASELLAAKEKEWNDFQKSPAFDPNDPTVAAKFREESLEPALDKFKEGFTTQKSQQFAEHFAEQFRNHMVTKTTADMSTQAGIAVHVNAKQTANNLASAVNRDPSSLDFSLKTMDASLDAIVGSSPNLSAADAAKVKATFGQEAKRGIVHSAVLGMLEKNPNTDLDAIQKKYGEYISGPEMKQFQKAAQSYQKTNLLTQKQIELAQRQLDVQAVHAAANKVMTDMVKIDPVTNRPVISPDYFKRALDIAKMPNAPDGLARTLIDWGEAQQNKETKLVSDTAVRSGLLGRIGAPDKPTTEIDILRAEADHKISHTDGQQLRALQKAVQDRPEGEPIRRGRDEFFKRYSASIDGAMDFGGHSALGMLKIYQAQMDARNLEDTLRKEGKDPTLVYDPRSEYFFGNPKNLSRYHVSQQEGLKYQRQLKEQQKAPTTAPSFKPPPNWQFSASRQQYRDPDGKVYDKSGKEIK